MTLFDILIVAGILAAASAIQSSSGFGFALFAIPLMLSLQFSLFEAVIITTVASALQKIIAMTSLWKDTDWKNNTPYMIIGFFALPIGVFSMYRLTFLNKSTIELLIGMLVFILLLLQWWGVIKSREIVAPIWGYIAGFFSGYLNGLSNIGGPPIVLWVLAHRWPNNKMRATPIAFSLVFLPFQLLFMYIAFHSHFWPPFLKGILSIPAVIAGTYLGLKIGNKISRDHLELYMRVLLLFVAVSSILKHLF